MQKSTSISEFHNYKCLINSVSVSAIDHLLDIWWVATQAYFYCQSSSLLHSSIERNGSWLKQLRVRFHFWLCWVLPFNRQGGSYSNKLLSVWNVFLTAMCILQGFFCFFFSGKDKIARGQQHCYPVVYKSSSQMVLRSWSSADGENQQICSLTLDCFSPLLYHKQNPEVQTDSSKISSRVQRYTKMINTATILQSPAHYQGSGPVSGYRHPNRPKVPRSSTQSQKSVLSSAAADNAHQSFQVQCYSQI